MKIGINIRAVREKTEVLLDVAHSRDADIIALIPQEAADCIDQLVKEVIMLQSRLNSIIKVARGEE